MGLEIAARNLWQKEWVGVWNHDVRLDYQYTDLSGPNALADLDATPEGGE